MNRCHWLLILTILVAGQTARAQSGKLPALLQRADSVQAAYPIEKVHLHLDKPYYAVGNTIWFKAYVVNGANKPSGLSKVLYAELMDEQQHIVQTLKLPLTAGLAVGDFSLTDTLSEGNYRIRAYTQWMRNFGEDSFFDQVIPVGNSLSNDILARVTYREDQHAVKALIHYSTLDGMPLTEQEVRYQVQIGSRNMARGKAITDSMGNLHIVFDRPREAKTGLITTTLTRNDVTVVKSIPLKLAAPVTVQFFPEGGQLVDSIPSKIGFKALGAYGRGVMVSGYVLNQQDIRVAEFRSEHAGMGAFMLTPFKGQLYTAVILLADGTEQRVILPASQPQGYVLTLTGEDAGNLFFRIKASRTLVGSGQLVLVAQTGSQVYEVSRLTLDKQYLDIAFPKKLLPTGIVQLTLFSPQEIPVAERLVFIQQHDQLNLNLLTDKPVYAPREKVKMKLVAKDAGGNPVAGSFSVAVTDLTRVPQHEPDRNSIFANLLLTSELKGYIERPNYYFMDSSAVRRSHLNLLLLTQGWRRFIWKSALPELVFKPEQGIDISGRVLLRGTPVEGGKVTLFTPDGGITLDTVTNSEGRFNFDRMVFADSTRFIIQARNNKDRANVQIELDQVPPQRVTLANSNPDIRLNVNSSMLPYLKESRDELAELQRQGLLKRTNLLKEVVVTASRRNVVENSSNLSHAPADYVFRAEQFENHTNLGFALAGKIPGIQVREDPRTKETTASLLRNGVLSGAVPMQLFVDGAPWGKDLSFVNVNDIATVEILKGGASSALYGNKGFGGVIIVTTKVFAGMPAVPVESPSGLVQHTPKGYTLTREFYLPDYDHPVVKKDTADLRTTIYWNPNLMTGDKNPFTFPFFTADKPGTYQAIVEGLDYKGRLGRNVFTFTVKGK